MPRCPFCRSTITEELDRFGGSCPQCFNHVPGEEAATDPGVDAVPAEDDKKGGGLAPVLLLVLVLLGAGFWFTIGPGAPKPEIVASATDTEGAEFYAIDLDELDATSVIPQIAGREKPVAPTTSSSSASSGRRSTPASSGSTTSSSSSSDASTSQPVAETPPPEEPQAEEPKAEPKASGASAGGGISVRRRAATSSALSDPAEIAAMVREGMGRYSEQFAQCVTQQLNQDESFGGVWELSLVVHENGTTDRVTARAKDGTEPSEVFEACMIAKVERWRFKTTTEAMAFKKRYTFGR